MRVALTALLATLAAAPAAHAQQATTAPTKTIEVNGKEVAYRTIGSGRPIVFVMGLGGTMDAWDPAFLDRIAKQRRRVVVFDNEGVGRTQRRSGQLTIRRMADTTAALISKLELQRPDVFGWSMGGMIAQSLAVRHPQRIRRVILAATAPGDRNATLPESDVLTNLANPNGNPARALGLLFPRSDSTSATGYVERITKRRNPNLQASDAVREAQVGAAGIWMSGNDPDGAKVRRLKMPVLVAGGAQDRVLPAPNQRHLARTIPKAQRAIYDNAAHGFFIQHAARFAARIDAFLAAG